MWTLARSWTPDGQTLRRTCSFRGRHASTIARTTQSLGRMPFSPVLGCPQRPQDRLLLEARVAEGKPTSLSSLVPRSNHAAEGPWLANGLGRRVRPPYATGAVATEPKPTNPASEKKGLHGKSDTPPAPDRVGQGPERQGPGVWWPRPPRLGESVSEQRLDANRLHPSLTLPGVQPAPRASPTMNRALSYSSSNVRISGFDNARR